MPGSGTEGIWPVFQVAADSGGVAGPVPAETSCQTTASLTQPPRMRARKAADSPVASWHNAFEPALPVLRAELAELAGADRRPG